MICGWIYYVRKRKENVKILKVEREKGFSLELEVKGLRIGGSCLERSRRMGVFIFFCFRLIYGGVLWDFC